MDPKQIIKQLPYSAPFHFVDDLFDISNEGISGSYFLDPESFFYQGHFKEKPVTPGVILTEIMAQIGVVCFGIYLLKDELTQNFSPEIALTSTEIDFFLPVFPGETVKVISEKEVFRFQKLKCKVKLFNQRDELVCRGRISGMMKIP